MQMSPGKWHNPTWESGLSKSDEILKSRCELKHLTAVPSTTIAEPPNHSESVAYERIPVPVALLRKYTNIWRSGAGRIWMKGGWGNKDTRVGVLNCSNRLLGSATTFMFYVLIYNAQCSFGNGSIMTVRVLKRLPRIRQKDGHPALVETRTSAPGFQAYGSHKSPHLLSLSLYHLFDFSDKPTFPGHNKSPIRSRWAIRKWQPPSSKVSCNFRRHSPGVRRKPREFGEINKIAG